LPPLVTHTNGLTVVLDFTPRQRRSFFEAVMRFGLPNSSDLYKGQWLVRDLRHKSKKVFNAYTSGFLRHLADLPPYKDNHFNDSVPVEGLDRNIVFIRIGAIALIRRKVKVIFMIGIVLN
jgi:chromodomain-helicase-DNA-binding protein 4